MSSHPAGEVGDDWLNHFDVKQVQQSDKVSLRIRCSRRSSSVIGDRYSGFTADLWNEVADRLGVTTEYIEVQNVGEQLDAVRQGDADLAATAISITSERERVLDFSLPYFDGGLQIMVPTSQDVGLVSSLRSLFAPSVLSLLGFFALALLVVGAIVAMIERRSNPDFSDPGFGAFGEGMWWAIVTVATVGYGDRVTRTIAGRIIAGVWILFGLVFVAQFTATVTTNLTVKELQTEITSPETSAVTMSSPSQEPPPRAISKSRSSRSARWRRSERWSTK